MTLPEVIRSNWPWFAIPALVLLLVLGLLLFITERSSIAPFLYFIF